MKVSARPVLVLMIGRTLGSAVSFLVPLVLVRTFDQAEFGTYKQLFLVYFSLYGIAQIGMAESLFYFVPLSPLEAGRCVWNSVLSLAGAGALCLGLLCAIAARVAAWLSNAEIAPRLPMIGGLLLFMLASSVLEIVLTSRKRFVWTSVAYAGSDVLKAALFVLPVLLFRRLDALLVGALVFGLTRCGAALLYLKREFGASLRPDATVLRRQLSYAVPFGMAAAVAILESNFHQYAVSHLFDAATFAVYSVGCLQIPLVDLVAGSACNVMMVRMAEALRDGREVSVVTAWRETTRKLASVFFPFVGLLVVTAPELVRVLFTERYAASVPIFVIWSITILLAVLQVDGVLRAYAETRFLLMMYVIKLALIAASIGWLISELHLAGAVLATVLAIVVAKGLALARIKARLRVPLSRLLPWSDLGRVGAAAGLAAAGAEAVRSRLTLPALPLLLAVAVAYALVYGALWLLLDLGGRRARWALRRGAAQPIGGLLGAGEASPK